MKADTDDCKKSSTATNVVIDKAVTKELEKIPPGVRDQFLMSLTQASLGIEPSLRYEKLKAAGKGVIELKVNGSPAYRCMYVVAKNGDVLVLHATSKTTEGQDRQLVKTTRERLKRMGPGRV